MDRFLPVHINQASLVTLFKTGEMSSYLIRHLSGAEKAAIFLIAVGVDTAARILMHLDPTEVEPVLAAVNNLTHVPKGLILAVLDELEHSLSSPNFKGGETYTKTLLQSAFGQRKAELLQQRLALMRSPSPHVQLSQIPPATLVGLLKSETSQTIAVVLSGLGPKRAGEVFALLPPEQQQAVSPRLGQLQEVQPELFHAIEDSLLKQYRDMVPTPAKLNVTGMDAIGQILAHSAPHQSRQILRKVQEQSPELASHMQQAMWRFEDLIHVTDRGIQLLIQKSPREALLYALKIAPTDVQAKFWRNMSQRQAAEAQSDMKALPPVHKSHAVAQQQVIVNVALQFEQQGELSLTRGSNEQWID